MKDATKAKVVATSIALVCGACTDTSAPEQSNAAAEFQKDLQLRLIKAKAGDVIGIPRARSGDRAANVLRLRAIDFR